MNVLLDTHVWIWSQEEPERLGRRALATLRDPETHIFISTVSTLEIARLTALKRLQFTIQLRRWVETSLRLLGAATIEVSHEIAMEAYQLPGRFHRDPADRLLAATARVHRLRMVTADRRLIRYPALPTVDAGK